MNFANPSTGKREETEGRVVRRTVAAAGVAGGGWDRCAGGRGEMEMVVGVGMGVRVLDVEDGEI